MWALIDKNNYQNKVVLSLAVFLPKWTFFYKALLIIHFILSRAFTVLDRIKNVWLNKDKNLIGNQKGETFE
jgi:hypothetical protein